MHLKLKVFRRPCRGSCTVLAVTGGSAAARLAPGYFPGVPPGRPVLRQSQRAGPTCGLLKGDVVVGNFYVSHARGG